MLKIETSFVPAADVFGEEKKKENAVLGATRCLHHKNR
jgi:hypothetical protein